MSGAQSVMTNYQFEIEFLDESGRVLHEWRLRAGDFGHAVRHTSFDAVRQGLVEEYRPLVEGARVVPVFPDESSSSPRARGFSVSVSLAGGRLFHSCDFGIRYFSSTANRFRAELSRNSVITQDQQVHFRLNAFLEDDEEESEAKQPPLSFRPATSNLPVGSGFRDNYLRTESWDEPSAEDLCVLLDSGVAEDIVAEAKSNPDHEIAGFLLGHLSRDAMTQEIFLAVTGFASAGGTTESCETSVTFTPASFVQAREMIRLRDAGERVCGWYHSHPFKLCAECPLPTPPECIAKVLFYSQDDIHLMETTFDQPFMVGLLATIEPRIAEALGHLPIKLYGWRNGEIRSRGFELFEESR